MSAIPLVMNTYHDPVYHDPVYNLGHQSANACNDVCHILSDSNEVLVDNAEKCIIVPLKRQVFSIYVLDVLSQESRLLDGKKKKIKIVKVTYLFLHFLLYHLSLTFC